MLTLTYQSESRLYELSIVAVARYHELHALKQYKFITLQLWRLEV